ncbi:MAG TPA: phage tail protein [Phycisphaerales bacterium]|nr:phage tail protein [Phycisphaerales bacterium]HMP38022.1 phage tail protein [Phycisphaerales bacterium]
MTQSVADTHRFDPCKNLKFRVRWDGRCVAGVSKVGGLKRSVEVVEHRDGAAPSTSRTSPGRTTFEAVTLERGVTHDPEFVRWAGLVSNVGGDAAMSLRQLRKDVIIELLNEAGQVAKAYRLHRCWVSEYQALPELDADTVAIAMLKLENEGWEHGRDAGPSERAPIRLEALGIESPATLVVWDVNGLRLALRAGTAGARDPRTQGARTPTAPAPGTAPGPRPRPRQEATCRSSIGVAAIVGSSPR